MNNLPVVYLYANLILHCIDAIEYITNVFSIKTPKMQEGEGREQVQATLALPRHCHACCHPPRLSLNMELSLSNPLWTPKIPECLCALTPTKAVDLSRNLWINCVDLGSSPMRSPRGKSSLSGSGREARDHLRGGGWPQPPANMLLGSLGTWPME